MIETTKVLGQAAPSAVTETVLYTVPALTSAVISTLNVCNRSALLATFRVSVSVSGAATQNKDYVYYDVMIPPNEVFEITRGITLGAGDVVRVYASSGNLSFAAFGVERS